MGIYLNPVSDRFHKLAASELYVDKTDMIQGLNDMMKLPEPMICVCRPRRFGKTITASMLVAYYCKVYDSRILFNKFKVSREESFEQNINKYDVLWLDMQSLISRAFRDIKKGIAKDAIDRIQELIIEELRQEFCDYVTAEDYALPDVIQKIHDETGKKFVIIIDEWDAVFRNYASDRKLQEEYTELLRALFKGDDAEKCIALAYITGILPPKKYGRQSPMNNFDEITMVDAGWMAKYMGFTEEEVKKLCTSNGMEFAEMQKWYDGYELEKGLHIYSPRSVIEAVMKHKYRPYWVRTETYESLANYISANFQGLKDDVIMMLSGQKCAVDTETFQNDLISFRNKDDIITLLIHFGYLAYDNETGGAYIPNEEVRQEFVRAVKNENWRVFNALAASASLLESTLHMEAEAVAEGLEEAHSECASVIEYNNENSLRCTVMIAYYSARDYYSIIHEMPGGEGYADVVFLPFKDTDKPALIVELKWNKPVRGAIAQIKEKHYMKSLENYAGKILLVGISYDEKKKHTCVIEEYVKS